MFVTIYSSSKHVLVNWYVQRTGAFDCVKKTYYVTYKQSAGRCNTYTYMPNFGSDCWLVDIIIVFEHQATWPTWIQKIMKLSSLFETVL